MKERALGGDIEASSSLGRYYYEIERDDEKALKWIKPASEAGSAEALYFLAEIYDKRIEDRPSNEEIVLLLTKSAEQGFTLAQVRLGEIYRFGRVGIPRDLEKARFFFDFAAAKGSTEALEQLQFIYAHAGNEKVKQKYADEELTWLELGAKQGEGEASLILAKKYELGQGVEKDYKRAAELYEQAAFCGLIEAKASLGTLYANGQGVKKDSQKAILFLTEASEHGFVEAQRKLSSMYTYEFKDYVQAYGWQLVALSAMFPDSKNLVETSPDFQRLMRSMTPEEIKDGQIFALKLVERLKENKRKEGL